MALTEDFPRFDLLESELARELQLKSSLEQRGITVITASGALVTLVFGFSALLTKGTTFGNFTASEKVFLVLALGSFVLASAFGVSANIPRAFGQLRTARVPPSIDVDRYYSLGVWTALRTGRDQGILADEISDAIRDTKNSNRRRAQAIRVATTLQAFAILALGFAVVLVVFHPGTNAPLPVHATCVDVGRPWRHCPR